MKKYFFILALICIGTLIGCQKTDMGESSLPTSIPSDEIHYTTSDGIIVEPRLENDSFGEGVAIVSNTYKNGKGIIKFNASVTSIGYAAFAGCTSLTSITIPDGVTSIATRAFYYCKSLTSIAIPEGITEIGSGAFSGCKSLTSITIPESVTSIGSEAFSWSGITTFYGKFASADNRCLIVDGRLVGFAIGCGETEYAIPPDVTLIGHYAFGGCESLTSIAIPEGITEIGIGAFRDCESLTSITIPEGITSIGSNAFYYCKSLTSITIPETITSIGDHLFVGCESLANVYFQATTPPESLLYAFGSVAGEFKSLQAIYVPKGSAELYKQALSEYEDLIQEYDFS